MPSPSQEPRPLDLSGAHEVADILGVSRQRVYQLSQRADFPEPVADLASGRIWHTAEIRQWDAARKKESGPPTHRRRA